MRYDSGQVDPTGGYCGKDQFSCFRRNRTPAPRCSVQGFTLIELLVVISIIALLLSVMMPALRKARQQAQATMCQSNMKQLGLASALYSQNNEDIIVPWQWGNYADTCIWAAILAPYIGDSEAAKGIQSSQWYHESNPGVLNVFRCPVQKDPFNFNFYLRYGINTTNSSAYDASFKQLQKVCKVTAFRSPYALIHITETMDNKPASITLDSRVDAKRYWGARGAAGFVAAPWTNAANGYNWLVGDRHKAGSNTLFFDGRVQPMDYYRLMYRDEDTEAERTAKENMWDYRR